MLVGLYQNTASIYLKHLFILIFLSIMKSETILTTLGYKKYELDDKVSYFKSNNTSQNTFSSDIINGLKQKQKILHPKYFYNEIGSKLFEQICELDEYYLTRSETEILESLHEKLSIHLLDEYNLIELGSGSSYKTKFILDILHRKQNDVEYFPIDISDILKYSIGHLSADYDKLKITGIIDTYEKGLRFVKQYKNKKNIVMFLGSSFGNFMPTEGQLFLKNISESMKEGDLFLIGLDLKKDAQILENAYNDSKGVTGKFNLNILSRINTELNANFDLAKFEHNSIFNESEGKIEMHLRSLTDQKITISKTNDEIYISRGESIITENSYKFTELEIKSMITNSGLEMLENWYDKQNFYSLVLAKRN